MVLKIAITSDVHYPDPRRFYFLTRFLHRSNPDILVIAGDAVSYGSINMYHMFFRKLRKYYRGLIVGVAGNHEHWLTKNELRKGMYSEDKIKRLAELYESHNAVLLNVKGSYCIGDVCFAGTTGWYDYSYALDLGFSINDFEKCNPWGCSISELWSCEKMLSCNCKTWLRDCLYVRLRASDKEYLEYNIKVLERQLRKIEAWKNVIVVLHHVPRKDLIKYKGDRFEDFYFGYAGSNRIDEALRKSGKNIVAVIYGHIHDNCIDYERVIDNMRYINGYEYTLITI